MEPNTSSQILNSLFCGIARVVESTPIVLYHEIRSYYSEELALDFIIVAVQFLAHFGSSDFHE